MAEPRSVSNSELSDWRTCKLRWWLRNVRELRTPEPQESAAQTGRLVHKLIAAALTGQDPTTVMQGEIQERGFLATDNKVLETFASWDRERWELYEGIEVDAVEQTLAAEVEGAAISGVVDVVGRTPEGFSAIVDHKTTGLPLSFWGRDNEMTVRHQLMVYDYLRQRVRGGHPEDPSIVAAHVVSTGGEGVRKFSWIVEPKARDLFARDLERRAAEVAASARAAEALQPTDDLYRGLMNIGRHCGNCDYRPLCSGIVAGQENTESVAAIMLERVPRLAYRQS